MKNLLLQTSTKVIKNGKIKGYYISTIENVKIFNKEGMFLCAIADPCFGATQATLLISSL